MQIKEIYKKEDVVCVYIKARVNARAYSDKNLSSIAVM